MSAGANPVHILLTNDDGYDSAGLNAVRTALVAKGFRVSVVAPLGQRSGSGMKITLGEFDVVEQAPGVWSVDASPADAVSIAIHSLLADDLPQMVVSGANFGQNLGANAYLSGTVGAAMMAALADIPAVAVSVGIRLEEHHAEPVRFPSTVAAFAPAAEYTAVLVENLFADGSDPVLPRRTVLNVNYPALPLAELKSARWAPQARDGGFRLIYPHVDGNKRKSSIEVDQAALTFDGTDTALFGAGHITLSLLKPDWNAPQSESAGVRCRLSKYLESPSECAPDLGTDSEQTSE